MANVSKYTYTACFNLLRHYERAKDDNGNYIRFKNIEINPTKTPQNYNLAPNNGDQYSFLKQRMSEVKVQKRKDVNVMCSWVVTKPKDVTDEETTRFFYETYKFLANRYGEVNTISAYVHLDETSPHIHFSFIPIVQDKRKGGFKVCAKELINPAELEIFHNDLSAHMLQAFGRDVGVLNNATQEGNKAIQELRRGTAVEKLAQIENECEEERKRLIDTINLNDKLQAEISGLVSDKTELQNKIKDLENILNAKELTKSQLDEIQPEKTFLGTLKNITLENVRDLKKTAMTALNEKSELEDAKSKIARLQKENNDLRAKIPTLSQQMKQKQNEVKIDKLENEIKRYKTLISNMWKALDKFEPSVSEFVENFVSPKGSTITQESYDSWDLDR